MAVVFISHRYSEDPARSHASVRRIARCLALEGHLPVAPQLYLPAFLDEATERGKAMRLSLRLLALCDEVRAYGRVTAGVREEVAEATRLSIPVIHLDAP